MASTFSLGHKESASAAGRAGPMRYRILPGPGYRPWRVPNQRLERTGLAYRSVRGLKIARRPPPLSCLPLRPIVRGGGGVDEKTLELLAEMICGDAGPVYRTGSELTRFFNRVGFSNFKHDGSTRKWWTLSVLSQLTDNNLKAVICRLANPREYNGDPKKTSEAIAKLNTILALEGLAVELDGVTPCLKEVTPHLLEGENDWDLKPLPPPNFLSLNIESGLAEILADRWQEAQKCVASEAFLAATIVMGSLLEGMMLAVMQRLPEQANRSTAAPVNPKTGKVKHFTEWTLSEMINVAHDLGWIDLDVKKFSHSLREFRNLIHPYQQWALRTYPDKDTCEISWLVVQAASNDLARLL